MQRLPTPIATQRLPRLLAGIDDRPMAALDQHLEVHGELAGLERWAPDKLIELIDAAGIRGHGGASFPVATKLRAAAARWRRAIVVANGSEGEPASKKDRVLLRELPHLVLDGAAVAARAIGSRDVIIALPHDDGRSRRSLRLALSERADRRLPDPQFELFETEPRYVSGQATALVSALNGGPGRPTSTPPRLAQRGVRGRPTLVQNVETLAHLALIARHGAQWFRQVGTTQSPGSALVTVSGAVAAPGVYEIAHGMLLSDLLDLAVLNDRLRAVLVGGYFGSWVSAAETRDVRLSGERRGAVGASLGAGVVIALGESDCPVAETSRIAEFFAAESAGQCGPCVHGLDAVANTVEQLAAGTADRYAESDLQRWLSELPGRGACRHPDGAARFLSSAQRVFDAEFRDHARHGPCERCFDHPVLATGGSTRRRG